MFLSGLVNHNFQTKMARPKLGIPIRDSVNASYSTTAGPRQTPSYECKVVDVKHRIHGRGPARRLDCGPLGKFRFRVRESRAMTWQQEDCSVHPIAADQALSLP